MEKRFIVIESTKYYGKYSVLDQETGEEMPCHNYATAKDLAERKNKSKKSKTNFCDVCECDPCDCYDGCEPEKELWKTWGDK